MITGHCLCGNISYSHPGEPLFQMVCCCEDCQRASGSSHVPVVGVTKKDFIVKGQTKTYGNTGGSGKQAIRHFCPDCGSLLFGTPESDPELVTIYAGTIDRDFVFNPTLAINTKAKAHWEVFANCIIQIKGMPK